MKKKKSGSLQGTVKRTDTSPANTTILWSVTRLVNMVSLGERRIDRLGPVQRFGKSRPKSKGAS